MIVGILSFGRTGSVCVWGVMPLFTIACARGKFMTNEMMTTIQLSPELIQILKNIASNLGWIGGALWLMLIFKKMG